MAVTKSDLFSTNVIVFDGHCVLCDGFFKFVLRHDKHQQFSFIIAQSELGEATYAKLGLKPDDYETNLLFVDGQLFTKLDAFTQVMRLLGWPWRIVTPVKFLPAFLKNWLYDRIAKNRYWIFGRHDTCMVPDAKTKARFLDLMA